MVDVIAANEGVLSKDILPEEFGDPMLMGMSEIDGHIVRFKESRQLEAAGFMSGVQFAIVSFQAAGLLLPSHQANTPLSPRARARCSAKVSCVSADKTLLAA